MNFEKQLVPYRILSLITISYILVIEEIYKQLTTKHNSRWSKISQLVTGHLSFPDQITTSAFQSLF